MASTSNIQNSSVAAVIQGSTVQITGNINMPVNNPQPEVNESEFDLPRLIDTFQGRKQELNTLDKLFFDQNKNKVVLHGLPGYGKTELCKQFALWCLNKKRVQRLFWIKAENIHELNKLSASLKAIYKNYKDVRCIFAFDNALNRRSICDFEPSNNKHKMLITSHVEDWGYDVESVLLKPLTSEPVTEIFRKILKDKYSDEEQDLYIDLGEAVDNVPLGVQVVAGYVRQRINCLGQSFRLIDYVNEIKESKHQIINGTFFKDNPNPYKNSIYSALTVSLNKMKEEEDVQRRELAVTVLYVCAFLPPNWINYDDFIRIPTITQIIGDKNSEIIKLTSAISLLVNFSFVNYHDTDEKSINIHRLVQSYLRQYLSSCDLEDKKCCSACVYAMFDNPKTLLLFTDVSTEQECVLFLEKVFQDVSGYATEIICEHNLFYEVAAWNGIQKLEILLQHADIDDHKVMHRVAASGNARAVELLIERGADVNHRDAAGRTPIESVLSEFVSTNRLYFYNIVSTLIVLLEHGAVFDKNLLCEASKYLLLSSAAEFNKLNVLESLIQSGLDVNSRGGAWFSNNSVLHHAIAGGNFEMIQMLVSHDADPSAINEDDETALFQFVRYIAIKNRNIDKQELLGILNLLECAELAQNTNKEGVSLLHLAAQRAHEELVTVLVEMYKCQVNKQDDDGNTPLHFLISNLDDYSNKKEVVQTVKTLLRYGASLSLQNHGQRTPLQLLKYHSKWRGYNLKYLVPLLRPTTRSCTLL